MSIYVPLKRDKIFCLIFNVLGDFRYVLRVCVFACGFIYYISNVIASKCVWEWCTAGVQEQCCMASYCGSRVLRWSSSANGFLHSVVISIVSLRCKLYSIYVHIKILCMHTLPFFETWNLFKLANNFSTTFKYLFMLI